MKTNNLNLVETLVETRINGNRIKRNSTYEAILKRITKQDIANYSCLLGANTSLTGTKLDMIEQLRNIEVSQ